MTANEEKAKTKWCPMARRNGDGDQGWNRSIPAGSSHDGHPARCLGSGCMAWRVMKLPDGERFGYCGLAGKP